MFSLKQHVRRHAAVVAVGAATLGLAAASHAADVTWKGGDGNFNNTDDFDGNGTSLSYAPQVNWNQSGSPFDGLGGNDNVTFGSTTTPVTIIVNGTASYTDPVYGFYQSNNTFVNSLTLNGGGYTFESAANGEGIVVGSWASGGSVTQVSGHNVINVPLTFNGYGSNISNNSVVNVIAGTLEVGTVTTGYGLGPHYKGLQKQGSGLLRIGALSSVDVVNVMEGTLLLSGTSSSTYFVVGQSGTLAGNATISTWGSAGVQISGHLAPGDNGYESTDDGQSGVVNTFGQIGTLTFNTSGKDFSFEATSNFDVDWDLGTGEHDILQLSGNVVNVYDGAQININFMDDGTLANGTYTYSFDLGDFIQGAGSIVDLDSDGNPGGRGFDFTVTMPQDCSYEMSDSGFGFKVTIDRSNTVPEPASLGLLGLGAGLLLLRRKR
ncbi:MAG: PEP-CTERM sorting domain-containing protein [Phycisphaerales bacterium]|nr:PEP-CTERM sorting domain-containing protein [Phycisphaerales bacterium]